MEETRKDFDTPIDAWACRTHMTADRSPSASQVDLLPQITARTLLLVGRDDTRCPPVISEKISAAVSGSKLVVFEKSGHLVWKEEPEQFYAEIRDWLAQAGV
jgi:proline iminopeptidase